MPGCVASPRSSLLPRGWQFVPPPGTTPGGLTGVIRPSPSPAQVRSPSPALDHALGSATASVRQRSSRRKPPGARPPSPRHGAPGRGRLTRSRPQIGLVSRPNIRLFPAAPHSCRDIRHFATTEREYTDFGRADCGRSASVDPVPGRSVPGSRGQSSRPHRGRCRATHRARWPVHDRAISSIPGASDGPESPLTRPRASGRPIRSTRPPVASYGPGAASVAAHKHPSVGKRCPHDQEIIFRRRLAGGGAHAYNA